MSSPSNFCPFKRKFTSIFVTEIDGVPKSTIKCYFSLLAWSYIGKINTSSSIAKGVGYFIS